jgi:tetratricopeptide (TPR) repeat protein
LETLFTWLHVSDLCLGAESPGYAQVLFALRKDLVERSEAKPDAIMVTGDLAFHGARDEHQAAQRWLCDLAKAVGLGPERVFVVPGNHDVDRTRTDDAAARLLAELRAGRRSLDSVLGRRSERARIEARLASFAEIAGALGPRSPRPDPLELSCLIEGRAGLRLRVIGLSTAHLSVDDADHGSLRVGAGPLERADATIEPGELVVVLSHHAPRSGWLADEADFADWLASRAHVHLTGHVHDGDAEEARGGVPGDPVWVAAGASLAAPDEGAERRRQAWSCASVVRAEDGSVLLRVRPRRWAMSVGRFVPDERVLRDGRPFVDRVLRFRKTSSMLPPPPPPSEEMRVPHLGVPKMPADLRVPTRAAASPAPPRQGPATIPAPPPGAPAAAPPQAAAAPPMIKAPPAAFSGRDAELARVHELLADPKVACVVIAGAGGVGKTALAAQVVASRVKQFDDVVWIDARDLGSDLARAAERFGLAGAASVEEAARFVRRALEGRRALVVIDNVDPGAAAVKSLPIPSPAMGSRVILTSRILTLHEDLGRAARAIRLGPWSDAAAREHLRLVAPTLALADDESLDALAQRVGGSPLGVSLLGRLCARPGATIASVTAALDRDALAALDGAAKRGEPTITSTFAPAVARLGELERDVLTALAACAPATQARAVAAVAGVREDDAALALEGLAEQALVEWDPGAERPFRVPAVLRLYLAAQPLSERAEAAHDDWAMAYAEAHREPADWQKLEREVPEVLAVVERRARRGDGAGAWAALSAVVGLLDRRGLHEELGTAAKRVLAAAAPDSIEAAAALAHLGLAQLSGGQAKEALPLLERALALAEEHGWAEGEGLALGGLGRCHAMLGSWQQAADCHELAATVHERLGMRRDFANDLANEGLAHRRLGDVAGAIERLERALAMHEELDLLDGRAEVLGGLGLCFRDIREHASAIEYFERALAIHEELGRRAGQATMLGNLGNTHRARGDLDKAIEYLSRALAIYEELGQLDGQATALGNLGTCYQTRGDAAKARDHLTRALAVLRRLGLPNDHAHVRMVRSALARLDGRGR